MDNIQREFNRVIPASSLKVFENSLFIGYLIDISEKGIMVLSGSPLAERKDYNFTVDSAKPDAAQGNPEVPFRFSARCRWTRRDDADKDCYLSGFEVTEIDDRHRKTIESLIRHGHLD